MNWMSGLLAAGFALSLVTAACGDDDTSDDTSAGTGGSSTGGKGGSSGSSTGGKSGSSAGTGGKGGSSGGAAVTPAKCISDTNTATGGMVNMACVQCACDEDATTIAACSNATNKMCWPLISCVGAMCAGLEGGDRTTCATTKCADYLAGATEATPAGMVLTGKCASKCVTSSGDAGVADAGF